MFRLFVARTVLFVCLYIFRIVLCCGDSAIDLVRIVSVDSHWCLNSNLGDARLIIGLFTIRID